MSLITKFDERDATKILFDCTSRNANRPRLLIDILGNFILNPPYGIRGEAKSQLRVKLFSSASEANDALLAGILELDRGCSVTA